MFNLIDYIEDKKNIRLLLFGRVCDDCVRCTLYVLRFWLWLRVNVERTHPLVLKCWHECVISYFWFCVRQQFCYLSNSGKNMCLTLASASAVYLFSQGKCNVSSLHCAHWLKQCDILAITRLKIVNLLFLLVHRFLCIEHQNYMYIGQPRGDIPFIVHKLNKWVHIICYANKISIETSYFFSCVHALCMCSCSRPENPSAHVLRFLKFHFLLVWMA